jgi:phosphoserine phosphatase RsbU/P
LKPWTGLPNRPWDTPLALGSAQGPSSLFTSAPLHDYTPSNAATERGLLKRRKSLVKAAHHPAHSGDSKPEAPGIDLAADVEALSSELSALLDPVAAMRAVSSRLVERHGVPVSAIWRMDEFQSTLEMASRSGNPELPQELENLSGGKTLVEQAAQSKKPEKLGADGPKGDVLAEWARKHELDFVGAYPLLVDSRVIGVLMVACRKASSAAQLSLFRLYSRLAALALRDTELLLSTQKTLAKLSFLVEASKVLSSTLDLSELLSRIIDVAKSGMDSERGSLFLVDEKTDEIWSLVAQGLEKQEIRLPIGKGIAGHVAKTGEVVNITDAYNDSRFNPEVDKRTGYVTRNILCLPIRNKAEKIIAVLQLLNKRSGPFTEEDAEFLLTLSGHMALGLENARLHQDLIEKERLEKEMALARGIQRSLLPESTPYAEGFDIALLNEPCYEVGGDYYDFMTLGPHTLLVVIADVEGKGVSSAMVMSNLQAALRSLVLSVHSLNEIAETLNNKILSNTRSHKYFTLFLGLIDLRRRAVHYITCGHVPPLIVRPGQDPISLTQGGMVIGLFENAQFERGYEKLQPGDIMALCTDGITEAMDAQDDEYGSERLAACIQKAADKKASEIVSEVNADVTRFSRYGTHIDDKVMIAIKVV